MPGVFPTTSARTGAGANPASADGRWLIPAVTERGPVDRAVRVRTLSAYETIFGGPTNFSQTWEQVRAHFNEGGSEIWIVRVVGATAAAATASLDIGKITVTAVDPGPHANGWTAAWNHTTHTMTVVTDRGTETYTGTTAAELLADADRSATVTVSSSGTLPAASIPPVALAGGTDARNTINAARMLAALDLLDSSIGQGAVSIPGWSAQLVGAGLRAHAAAHDRVALLATDRVSTLAEAGTLADTLRAADTTGSSGLFWPWVQTPTGEVLSPEGAVAGHRADIVRQFGVWTAAAGGNGTFRYIVAPDQAATPEQANAAHDDHAINVIRVIAGKATVYGWRSLSTDEATWRYLSYRDTLNRVCADARTTLEPYVYLPLTAALVEQVRGSVIGMLRPLIVGGGLYPLADADGNQVDPGWSVEVDQEVDDATGAGALIVSVTLRLAPAAEAIRMPIAKVPVGAAL